jgi:hypothetical protein
LTGRNSIDWPPVPLANVNPNHHQWLELTIVGVPKSSRGADRTTVYLKANGKRMRQGVLAGGLSHAR